MRKKKSKMPMDIVKERRPDLYEAMLELLGNSRVLLEAAEWDSNLVSKWVKKSEEALKVGMDWDEKELMCKEGAKYYRRLAISREALEKFNMRYEELREEIIKEFGKDILPDRKKKETPPEDDKGE